VKSNNSKRSKQKDKFPLAVKFYETGDIKSATSTLESMIKENPKDFDALAFLGGINLSSGDFEKAADYFQKVTKLYPQHPTAHYNLGLSNQRLNKLAEAEENYKKALAINPKYVDAVNNLGVIYTSFGKMDEAREYYKKALDIEKDNSSTINNLGNLESSLKNYAEAESYYLKAISLEPDNSVYPLNISDCYIKQGRFDDAEKVLEKLIENKPGYYQAYNSLGVVALKKKKYEEAEKLFLQAIKINEEYWEAYQDLGYCYEKMNMNSEAVLTYKRVLEINNDINSAKIKLSNMFLEEGRYSESEKYLQDLGKNEKIKALSYTNLGVSKLKQGKIDEAIEYTAKALNENDQLAITHYNYSHALLLQGNFIQGWNEYEWRKLMESFEPRSFSKPVLIDENIFGKKILVCCEQGLGDTIHFVRYLPMLKKSGAYVIFECDPRLAEILSNCEGIDQFIIREGKNDPPVEYDYYTYLLSLPLYFQTESENIPAKVPYISINKSKIENWSKLIAKDGKINVGLVWAGNPKHVNDKNRSCDLQNFSELFEIPRVRFISLQKGKGLEQIEKINSELIANTDSLINTFEDTAAAIMNLDLVISVDTSVAHLAGALGKDAWIMLPFLPDWRWQLERSDSPWYPSIRLFRQSEEKKWDGVISNLKTELLNLVKNKYGESALENISTSIRKDNEKKEVLYLGLTSGSNNYGWGVVCNYIKKEVSNKINVHNIADDGIPNPSELANSKLFQLLTDVNFNPLYAFRGKENYGYTVFESELNLNSINNSKKYDKVVCASTWNKEKMEAKGITNTGVVIQGIDTNLFYPSSEQKNNNLFIIFSGGKFELRKGQDLVIKAFGILHKKYPDMILINAWYNLWPELLTSMKHSSHIKYEMQGNTWHEFMSSVFVQNNIDLSKVFVLPLTPSEKLRDIYLKSDVGLFPNRCEGGTNLVLMEYMACGKPAVASFNSGHKDILTEKNSIMLKEMKKFELYSDKTLTADWEEPSLDEIISSIEYAYHNRKQIRELGKQAAFDMKNFTWEKTAESLLREVNIEEGK
jgi:tetratricopeptide (TPR) repeat protein/glycosyltransferase involved in cell wall biosynthesis